LLSERTGRALAPTVASVPARLTVSSDRDVYVAAVYLALLQRLPEPAFLARIPDDDPLRRVAAALLDGGAPPAAAALETLSGDDAVVLAALALRRGGTQGWNAFRDQRAELAQRAGVSASALRALSRLDRAPLNATRP
jgi:hypothetical protein